MVQQAVLTGEQVSRQLELSLLETVAPAPLRRAHAPRRAGLRGLLAEAGRRFVEANRALSRRATDFCRERFDARNGYWEYYRRLAPQLRPGITVIDLGGGKHPSIHPRIKDALGLTVVGVDISPGELLEAPEGAYDERVVSDAAAFVRPGRADLVVSRALLEHVADPARVLRNVYRTLVPGGCSLHFVPNGNAFFALANRALPQDVKRALLYSLYPETRQHLGFPAYYRHCTPSAVRALLHRIGYREIVIEPFYCSNYLEALAPAHASLLAWQQLLRAISAEGLCENFLVTAWR